MDNQLSLFESDDFIVNMDRYQSQWGAWREHCYVDPAVINSVEDNARRFAEESAELLQATGMSLEEAIFMVRWVYSRPKGEPAQEAAGALNTLVTLANSLNINLGEAGVKDLMYCWANIGKIREKQAMKPVYRAPVQMPEWNNTNIQKAIVMGLHGTPEQQEEARAFLKHHMTL